MFRINAAKLGINANDTALKKLMSKCPVYFKINNITDVKIESVRNNTKIIFFTTLFFK